MNKTEVDALWDEYERKHLVPEAYAKLDHYLRNNLDDVDYTEYSQALDVVLSASDVAEGWKLVPVEPTDAMIRHLVAELQGECVNIFKPEGWWEDIRSALRDAIAAA